MGMNNTNTTIVAPKRTPWATVSIVLCAIGWVCAGLVVCHPFIELFYDTRPVWRFSLLCWILSLISGIISLVRIKRARPVLKGKAEAIVGICLSVVPLILISTIAYVFYLALRGEPYDESHPASVIATIETNCKFKFPEKMESLKAADRIGGGVSPKPYLFIVSFTTDQNGFAQLRDSLSLQPLRSEDYDTNDPRVSSLSKGTPQWYKAKMPKGIIYEGFLVSKNNMMRLSTFCVELPEPEKVAVYMEGFGDPRLKQRQD
jgi:hypothetical protein